MVDKHILSVFMNGTLVGKLEKMNTGGLQFSYHSSWLQLANARPISLSLPLIEKTFTGDIVYNFFDNLLPDNPIIKSRIQTKFKTPTSKPFDLLASIGKDCVGAIQLIQGEETSIPYEHDMEFQTLTDKDIASLLNNTQAYPLGMHGIHDEFRISIAGVQEKTALLYWNGKWHKPLNTTPTSHIFKLPIGYIPTQQMDLSDSCENEWLCSKIAEAFELPIAKCDIQYFENVKALVVKRFDRKLSKDNNSLIRLPQEDMCQALGISPNLKYEADGGPGITEIMHSLLGSSNPIYDRDTFFKAQVLFWLLAAIDGHAKNFSLQIEAGSKYSLAPLYDIISAHPLVAKKQLQTQKLKMAMALKGKNSHYHWYQMQSRHFLDTADHANYSRKKAEEILNNMLTQVDSVIEKISALLPINFPTNISEPIFQGMRFSKHKLLAK